jgi:hypothetical protein
MLSETVQLAIVSVVPAVISAIFAGLAAVRVRKVNEKVEVVHKLLNSRLTELVSASKDSGRIEEQHRVATQQQQQPHKF